MVIVNLTNQLRFFVEAVISLVIDRITLTRRKVAINFSRLFL